MYCSYLKLSLYGITFYVNYIFTCMYTYICILTNDKLKHYELRSNYVNFDSITLHTLFLIM